MIHGAKNTARIGGFLTIVFALLALSGWIFHVPVLKSFQRRQPELTLIDTLCFLLSGVVLSVLDDPTPLPFTKRLIIFFSCLILLAGLWDLGEYFFHLQASITELLTGKLPTEANRNTAGRINWVTAAGFIMISLIFLLISKRRYHLFIELSLILFVPALLTTLFGFVSGVNIIDDFVPGGSGMALPGVLMFLFLTAGIATSAPLRYIRFSFQEKIASVLAAAILALFIIFFTVSKANKESLVSNRLVQHTHQVLLVCEKIRGGILEMQSDLRGFLISGEYLQQALFYHSSSETNRYINVLGSMTRDNTRQQTRIDSLAQSITSYIRTRQEQIRLKSLGEFNADSANASVATGTRIINESEEILGRIGTEENQLLDWRKANNEAGIHRLSRVIFFFKMVIIGLLVFAFWSVYRNNRSRNLAEAQIRELNETLEKRVEERTKQVIEKEEKYKFLLQNMREGIQVIGYNWRYLFVNHSFAEQNKYLSEQGFVGHSLMEKYPGIEHTELFAILQRCMAKRHPHIMENEFTFPDGRKEWFELSIQPVPEGLFILSLDITERKKGEIALKESEQRYRSLVDNSLAGVFESMQDGKIVYANGAFLRIFQYNSLEELVTDKGVFSYRNHSRQDELVSILRKEGKVENFTTEMRTKSGKIITLLLNAQLRDGLITGMLVDITEKRKLEQELAEQKLAHQKLITEITIEAQEKERHELGKELHDNVNQVLATSKMFLGLAKERDKGTREELISGSYHYISQAIEEIRRLSHSLVPPSLNDVGLHDVLQELVDEFNIGGTVKGRLEYAVDPGKEPVGRMGLMLYRVVQEQLNNIHKYSRASSAVIRLKDEDDQVVLTITDNGIGFDKAEKAKGIGLKNIRSRVEFYNGNVNIISSPGKGCRLEVIVPLLKQEL